NDLRHISPAEARHFTVQRGGVNPLFEAFEHLVPVRLFKHRTRHSAGSDYRFVKPELQLRTCLNDLLRNLELLEVLDKQLRQLLRGGIIFGRISPGVTGVEKLAIDAWYSLRHVEIDYRQMLGLGTDQSTGLHCGNNRPR